MTGPFQLPGGPEGPSESLQHRLQLGHAERLLQDGIGLIRQRIARLEQRGPACEQDHRRVWGNSLHALNDLPAIQVWHAQIRDDGIEWLAILQGTFKCVEAGSSSIR